MNSEEKMYTEADMKAAIAAEREACAKVAEECWTEGFADEITQGIAAEIRARGGDA